MSRSVRPTPPPSPLDRQVIVFHGIPYAAWLRLTPAERATRTDQYLNAQGATR